MPDPNQKIRELSHPTPWYVDVTLRRGVGPVYRVSDALHNAITDFYPDKNYIQSIVDNRNEDPDIKAENVQALWVSRWKQYQLDDIEKNKRWKIETESLVRVIRLLQDELKEVKNLL